MRNSLQCLMTVLVGAAGISSGTWATANFLNKGDAERYIVGANNQALSAPAEQFGIGFQEAKFVALMRGPIASISGKFGPKDKQVIREALKSGYSQDGAVLDQWAHFNSDRERLIAYLVLRVNGSLPIYSVRPLPTHVSELLSSRDGNCGDQAFRLAMVLDLFSIESRTIAWHTQAIEGHWFVDAYDPLERKSYFLDPTNNLMALQVADKKGTGFLDFLASLNASERVSFLTQNLIQFPLYYEGSVGLPISFNTWSSNNYVRARDSTITGLSYELPGMMSAWQTGKSTRPTSLCDMAASVDSEVGDFEPAHCLSTVSLVEDVSYSARRHSTTLEAASR